MLYSDLLSAPEILTREHRHFAPELDGLIKNLAQLLERIVEESSRTPARSSAPALPRSSHPPSPVAPVADLAAELHHLQPLLAAIAGPSIKLTVATMPCAGHTSLALEDLTRVLVNLVRNAADAMTQGGHIHIEARYVDGQSFVESQDVIATSIPCSIEISVTDDGPGIPRSIRARIFKFGFSTRLPPSLPEGPPRHRGLGLSIVRHLIESAGGSVSICTRQTSGTRLVVRIPLTGATGETITSGIYGPPLSMRLLLTS
jgi:signal transduction histidine kinase